MNSFTTASAPCAIDRVEASAHFTLGVDLQRIGAVADRHDQPRDVLPTAAELLMSGLRPGGQRRLGRA